MEITRNNTDCTVRKCTCQTVFLACCAFQITKTIGKMIKARDYRVQPKVCHLVSY